MDETGPNKAVTDKVVSLCRHCLIYMRTHIVVPHQDKSIGHRASLVLLITEKKLFL